VPSLTRNIFTVCLNPTRSGLGLWPLWELRPSPPETVKKHGGQSSPAERLNGKCDADKWLENLLVSGSMNGVEQDPQNPL
jgi:hypothetical protein